MPVGATIAAAKATTPKAAKPPVTPRRRDQRRGVRTGDFLGAVLTGASLAMADSISVPEVTIASV
jgi:hypothetical protein